MSRAKLRRYYRHGLLPQLFVFEAVARLGGVTRAAEELHLAQPTVSVQLKKLSETLDLILFEQHGRSVQLTAGGHALRDICGDLMSCLQRADEKLARLRAPAPETLLLVAEPGARKVASRLLAAYCSRHPEIQGSLRVVERAELLARCASGKDDVYLFELEVDGLQLERRWSVAHAKGRALAHSAAEFLREALLEGAAGEPGLRPPQ